MRKVYTMIGREWGAERRVDIKRHVDSEREREW